MNVVMEKMQLVLLDKLFILVSFHLLSLRIFCFVFIAKIKKFDVVLIDTAGRMENDEPLMNALAKVITWFLFII